GPPPTQITIASATSTGPISATGVPLAGNSGVLLDGATVATFTDTESHAASDYHVAIDWGDGSPDDTTTPVVSGTGGSFTIQGGHTYQTPGLYAIGVQITRTGADVPIRTTALISPAPYTLTPVSNRVPVNTSFGQLVVATLNTQDL